MALIQSRPTKGGKPAFRVRIRVKGCAEVSATFARRTDAKLWAQKTEADIRAGKAFPAAAALKHTVGELIDAELRAFGYTPGEYPVTFTTGTPGDTFGIQADIGALCADTDWAPKVKLETGLERMVAWARSIQ